MATAEQIVDAIVRKLDYEHRRYPHLILNGDGDLMWVASLMDGDDVVWSDPAGLIVLRAVDADAIEPGACGDPECHVLHADPANPIHPPFYKDSRVSESGDREGSTDG